MFNDYITNLIQNITKKENTPIIIDLVLEGGANNGLYELGVLLFIKEMERKEYIKIDRISGVSIGSYLGFHYFNDSLLTTLTTFENIKTYFKEHLTIEEFNNIVQKDISNCSLENFNTIKSDKLFINSTNLKERKQELTSFYENKNDLYQCIIKSSFVPFLFNREISYQCDNKEYVDGFFPHIFNNRSENNKKILYISINQLKKFRFMFSSYREKNNCGRVLEGILDAYTFFLYEKPTQLCSYVNQWSRIDYISLRGKQFILVFFIFIIYCFTLIYYFIDPYLHNIIFYNIIHNLVENCYKDFLLYYCF